MENPYGKEVHWLSDEDYQKAVGHVKLQLNGILNVFHGYGMDIYIPEVTKQITSLCEDFGLVVRGISNHPIVVIQNVSKNGLNS